MLMSLAQETLPAILGGKPLRKSFLTFGAPLIGEEEIAEVVDTLRSGWIGFGPKCLRLEEEFAKYVEASYAASVGSCTAALHLALLVAGVRPGDEVITTPLTFASTVNVIEHVGARPVFVDVERDTMNISPQLIEAAITPRTRAIIPVHMAGRPADMPTIIDMAARYSLVVIEDAAHAIEAISQGRKVGSIAHFTAFSFYATKNLTTAEGGMITSANSEAMDRVRRLRLHGLSADAWKRYTGSGFASYEVMEPGFKCNLTDLQASLGLHQLARIEENLIIREHHWKSYEDAFRSVDALELPAPCRTGDRHARHLFTLILRPECLNISRDRFLEALQAENIGAGIHFMPVHLHEYYHWKYGFKPGDFPIAEEIGAHTISIPFSARLSEGDVQDTINAVHKILRHFTR